MEDSERGREVTERVALWIENDGELIDTARYKLSISVEYLEMWLRRALKSARPHSAAWQVAQDLSPRDYGRIDWAMVAERIKAQF